MQDERSLIQYYFAERIATIKNILESYPEIMDKSSIKMVEELNISSLMCLIDDLLDCLNFYNA